MLIGDKKTFLGYRCPTCGGGVLGMCSELSLSGGRLLRLRCPCGESDMTVTQTTDGAVSVTVPCLLCNSNHIYRVHPSVFFGRDLFLLNCAYSNLDVAFIGEEERVSQALDEHEATLRKIFADAGLSTLARVKNEERNDDDILPDAQVLDVVRFLVRELEADGQIDCPCHNGEYDVEFTRRGVRVFCRNCESTHTFEIGSLEAAQDLLSCDHLSLIDPTQDKSR